MNDKEKPQNRYIAQVWNILNEYKELLNNDIIILGDFNWNIIWDEKERYPLVGDFREVNDMLNKYDIESVYHHYFKEDFGKEKIIHISCTEEKINPINHINFILTTFF